MTLSYSFFYIFDLSSGNLKIEIIYGKFVVEDKDRETTTCLNNIKIGKLEFLINERETPDSKKLNWILSLFYPRSQYRLVIYLFI